LPLWRLTTTYQALGSTGPVGVLGDAVGDPVVDADGLGVALFSAARVAS
jgi:hypothetical protein